MDRTALRGGLAIAFSTAAIKVSLERLQYEGDNPLELVMRCKTRPENHDYGKVRPGVKRIVVLIDDAPLWDKRWER